MGFLSKLKNTIGQLAGTTANVQMQVSNMQAHRGDSIAVMIAVNATGQLTANGVFLELVGMETLEYEYEVTDSSSSTSKRRGTKCNETYRQRDTLLAGGLVLNQGETRQFQGTIQIPHNALLSYNGVEARHEWKIRGIVEVSMGADPDCEIQIFVS